MADFWAQKGSVVAAFRSIKQQAQVIRQPRSDFVERPQLVLYPCYSYLDHSAQDLPYCVTVRGWLYTEGDPNKRRNRVLMATTERFVGSTDPASSAKLEQQLIDLDGATKDADSAVYGLDRYDTMRSDAPRSETLRGRLAPFFRKGLGELPVEVAIYGKNGEFERFSMDSDTGGRFEHTVHLSFTPTKIRADFDGTDSIVYPIFVPPHGVSVISDVDDTIRKTGILDGKRDTLRNVLLAPFDQVKIEGVSLWYRHMQSRGAAFHYVSNSPWQMYDVVAEYLRSQQFPQGSIHLKRYNGVIDGIFEPVAHRKVKTLHRIFRDFPNRKFILVGDGGELDLETYVQIAIEYPHQVSAIYIRDLILPKNEPLEINVTPDTASVAPSAASTLSADSADLIDLGSSEPKVPPKNTKPGRSAARAFNPLEARVNLPRDTPNVHALDRQRAQAELNQTTVGGVAGALFGASSRPGVAYEAAHLLTDSIMGRKKPPPPTFINSSQDYSEYEKLDKERRRIDGWKSRVIAAKRALPEGVELKTWRQPGDVEASALRRMGGEQQLL